MVPRPNTLLRSPVITFWLITANYRGYTGTGNCVCAIRDVSHCRTAVALVMWAVQNGPRSRSRIHSSLPAGHLELRSCGPDEPVALVPRHSTRPWASQGIRDCACRMMKNASRSQWATSSTWLRNGCNLQLLNLDRRDLAAGPAGHRAAASQRDSGSCILRTRVTSHARTPRTYSDAGQNVRQRACCHTRLGRR